MSLIDPSHRMTPLYILSIFFSLVGQAIGAPSISIKGVSAPHPKHCMSNDQWWDPISESPYNLFDGDRSTAWVPCGYAIKEPGYTIEYAFETPVKIDGVHISQRTLPTDTMKSKRKRRSKKSMNQPVLSHRMIKRMQVLYFNRKISSKFPIYYQDVLFEGQREVNVRYTGTLKWNAILLKDSGFDERRRKAGFPPTGMQAPIEIDGVGLVFWELNVGDLPPALEELTLTLGGQPIKVTPTRDVRRSHAKLIGSIYPAVIKDVLLIGDERSLVFSNGGTIWGLEGEEEVPKIMGAWRYKQLRMEIDLSWKQRHRSSGKKRVKIEKQRTKKYKPIKMIIDETPDRLWIEHPRLGGEYETRVLATPLKQLLEDGDEEPPVFE